MSICRHRAREARTWNLAVIAVAVWMPWNVGAQSLTGAFLGTVRDTHGGSVPGAVVRIGSAALIGGSVEVTTNDKGQVRFPVLPPGTYAFEITKPGFTRAIVSGIEVGAGETVARIVVLEPASVSESVVVSGAASRLLGRQPGFGTRFGPEDLRTIPTRRASMFDVVRAAPGISPTSPSSGTATTVSAFGSGINTNAFLIDGTNFTCPCIGVARSEPGIDFIHEVQVQTAGASAEFGNIQGAVINVIMRQGSDRFLYDASSYWQPAGLTSQPVRLPLGNIRGERETGYERVRYRDATANVGGPIIRNRLWFFAGYQHLRDSDSQPGTDGTRPRRYQQDKVVGKFTWRPAPGWTVFNSFHGEFWVNPQQPTINRPYETTLRASGSVPSFTFGHVTHSLSANTVWDMRVGHFVYNEESRPSTGDPTAASRADIATNVLSGAPPVFTNITLGRTSAKATLSHYRTGLFGADHDLKAGGQVERGGHTVAIVVPTGERFIDNNRRPFLKIARAPSRIGGEFSTAAAFVTDSIKLGDRLTISAGVRFEHNRAFSQDLHGVDLAGRTTDEIFRGLGTLYTWNVLSPRLGATTKLDRGGRTILRASYGRFYQGVLTAEIDFFHPGAAPVYQTNLVTGQVRVDDPKVNLRLDPQTRAPHTDEYSVGVDRQLGRRLAVAIAYVHKNGRDAIGWTDIAGRYRQETRTLGNGMSVPVFLLDTMVTPPDARRYLLTNQKDYAAKYHGLVIAAEKRRSHGWQAFGSYTLSRATGLQPSSGTTAGGEQSSTVGPAGTFGRDPNDLTNARGRLANDRPHVVRVMASIDVPRTGLLVAGNLQHFSGKPWAATTDIDAGAHNPAQRILLEPRGSRRLSSQTLLDLRVSRAIVAARAVRIELLADVLNALNEAAEEGLVSDRLATVNAAHEANFGLPNVFVDPRRVMFGVRFNFGAR